MKRSIAVSLVLLLNVAGCDVDWTYALSAVFGQINLLQRTVPLDDVLANGNLTDDQLAKLELIIAARLFARDRIGLYVENSFTTYYDSGDEPVATNLSASRRDRFEPLLWTFPVVGTIPYLGYFDAAAARQRRDSLVEQGWDVFLYEIDAYNVGVISENPVLSPVLRRDDYDLADLVIHELLHATIWRANDVNFNESMATFIGRTGAGQFFSQRFPDDPDQAAAVAGSFEDADRYFEFSLGLYAELDAFYGSDLTSNAKISGRDAIFQAARDRFRTDVQPLMHTPDRFDFVQDLPVNNAFLAGIQRYNDLNDFALVFAASGQNWPVTIRVFREAAATEGDAFAYLRNWAGTPKLKRPDRPASRLIPQPADERGPCRCRLATTLTR